MRGATQRGGPLKSDAARTVTPGPHHESHAKGFPHRTEGFWHGSTEMSRHIAKPDHTGRTLGDMTEERSEAEGHRRLHTRTHRRDSLSERDQVHGLARTMFVCDAPPLGRRPEHRIDRLTPIRPQMGRLLEHGVSANGLTRCMQARSAPARAECAHRRAFKVHPRCSNRVAMLRHTRITVTMMTEDKTIVDALATYTGMVTQCPPGRASAPDAKERGRAQFQCVCGHSGTLAYPKLFKRLRRRRGKPLRLRCQRCGQVLR
jgi:hypothetical protein